MTLPIPSKASPELHTACIESADLEVDAGVHDHELAIADGEGVSQHKFQLQVLTAAGYEISEDPNQPGLWIWQLASAGGACDVFLGSREEAIDDAWMDAGHRVSMAEEISWNGRTLLQQADLINQVLGAHADGGSAPAPTNV